MTADITGKQRAVCQDKTRTVSGITGNIYLQSQEQEKTPDR